MSEPGECHSPLSNSPGSDLPDAPAEASVDALRGEPPWSVETPVCNRWLQLPAQAAKRKRSKKWRAPTGNAKAWSDAARIRLHHAGESPGVWGGLSPWRNQSLAESVDAEFRSPPSAEERIFNSNPPSRSRYSPSASLIKESIVRSLCSAKSLKALCCRSSRVSVSRGIQTDLNHHHNGPKKHTKMHMHSCTKAFMQRINNQAERRDSRITASIHWGRLRI